MCTALCRRAVAANADTAYGWRSLHECRLYGIIDLGYVEPSDAGRVVEQMIEGGVDLIQLRGKGRSIEELSDLAAALHQLTMKSSTSADRERSRRGRQPCSARRRARRSG